MFSKSKRFGDNIVGASGPGPAAYNIKRLFDDAGGPAAKTEGKKATSFSHAKTEGKKARSFSHASGESRSRTTPDQVQ